MAYAAIRDVLYARKQNLVKTGLSEDDAEEMARTEWNQGVVFDLFGYPVNIKDIAWTLLIMKYLKHPNGLKLFNNMLTILKDALGNISKMAHHDSQTTSYGVLFLQALVLRRFGLITDSDFGGFIGGISATNAAETGAKVMEAFPVQFKVNVGLKGTTPQK